MLVYRSLNASKLAPREMNHPLLSNRPMMWECENIKYHFQAEDDGVVIAAMVWGGERDHEVGLLVLDGQTFQELGRATFTTPTPAPKCLHGWFHPSSKSPKITGDTNYNDIIN